MRWRDQTTAGPGAEVTVRGLQHVLRARPGESLHSGTLALYVLEVTM